MESLVMAQFCTYTTFIFGNYQLSTDVKTSETEHVILGLSEIKLCVANFLLPYLLQAKNKLAAL